jgi:hypothetical protein
MASRDAQIRELAVRALTKPINLIPAALIAAVGLAFGLWPLLVAAPVVYVLMAGTTFWSTDEARKVIQSGREPRAALAEGPAFRDPRIERVYREAVVEEERIRQAVDDSPAPTDAVEAELIGLTDDLRSLCERAQRISDYLASVDVVEIRRRRAEVASERERADADLRPTLGRAIEALDEQLATVASLQDQLRRFHAETVAVVGQLGAIRGQVVQLSVGEADASERVRAQLGAAREHVNGIAEALAPDPGARAAPG